MFEEFAGGEGSPFPWSEDLSVEPTHEFPVEAWERAPLDEDGDPRPEWMIDGGRAFVSAAATKPADAWEQAADFLQARLDEAEVVVRGADLARIDAMRGAADASLMDLRVRFGLHDAAIATKGLDAFAKQTGLALGMSPGRVKGLLATADTAERLLPRTWAVYRSLACPWYALQIAVDESADVPGARMEQYDEAAADLVASTPMTRLHDVLRKKRERLQDETADARARSTEIARTVRFRATKDGGASLTYHGSAAELAAVSTALTKAAIAAKADDEPRTVTQLRYDIGLDLQVEGMKDAADTDRTDLRVPHRKGIDVVAAVTVPALAWLGITKEQATLEGVGPFAVGTALALAAHAPSLIRILTDPITGVRVALDRTVHRPPADLARWVRYRDQRCRFPGCNRVAAECDQDHAVEWQNLGVTNDDNLVTLCRGTHVAKTMGLWQEELLANGHVDWESPWDRHFTDPPPDPADPAPRHLLPDECPF